MKNKRGSKISRYVYYWLIVAQTIKIWYFCVGNWKINPGVAFSFGSGWPWVVWMVIVSLIVIMITVYRREIPRIAWILVLSGAVSNGIDRMVYGGIVDYWYADFLAFNYFNLADVLIVSGCCYWVVVKIPFILHRQKWLQPN